MNRYPVPTSITAPMAKYKYRRQSQRTDPLQDYDVLGYIAAGTYGRVYKAQARVSKRMCAIKKFKTDKEGEISHYTGLSQSAYREMALCRELNHENVIYLIDAILEDKCVYLVFDYAEHDLLQLIHFQCHPHVRKFPPVTIKSILLQILEGVDYLHRNWILHRDLKPANIMITANGVVKIGDLGLARIFNQPLQPLYAGDKVVVTIWYRAPELLLGGRHYDPAIDLWAIGCIYAEMLSLKPVFKSEEAKMENKKVVPFQRDQMQKIVEILGMPNTSNWPELSYYPDSVYLQSLRSHAPSLPAWYNMNGYTDQNGLSLLSELLEYNPMKRLTARQGIDHPYFKDHPKPQANAFEGTNVTYPTRRLTTDTKLKGNGPVPSKRGSLEHPAARKKTKA